MQLTAKLGEKFGEFESPLRQPHFRLPAAVCHTLDAGHGEQADEETGVGAHGSSSSHSSSMWATGSWRQGVLSPRSRRWATVTPT